MKNGANILQVATAIKKVEAKFVPTLPPNIRLATAYEQASAVKEKIDIIYRLASSRYYYYDHSTLYFNRIGDFKWEWFCFATGFDSRINSFFRFIGR